ncbi:MAG: hypothetical protein OHK0056_27640 [Bacteriovoracaceae bacterium]
MKLFYALALILPTFAMTQICPEDVDVIAPKLLLERGYGINTKDFPTKFVYDENLKNADIDLKEPTCFNRQFKELSKKIKKDYKFEHIEIYENPHPRQPNQMIATFVVRYYDDSRTDQFLSMSESQMDSDYATAGTGKPADYICYAHVQFECPLMDERKVDQSKRKNNPKSITPSEDVNLENSNSISR